jgi:hypothetical protein
MLCSSNQVCKSFYNGLVGLGLFGAFNEFLQVARRALQTRSEAMVAGTCVPGLSSPDVQLALQFSRYYLAAGMRIQSGLRASEALAQVDSYLVRSYFCIPWILFVGFYFCFAFTRCRAFGWCIEEGTVPFFLCFRRSSQS